MHFELNPQSTVKPRTEACVGGGGYLKLSRDSVRPWMSLIDVFLPLGDTILGHLSVD